jgi:hypothetical protein
MMQKYYHTKLKDSNPDAGTEFDGHQHGRPGRLLEIEKTAIYSENEAKGL